MVPLVKVKSGGLREVIFSEIGHKLDRLRKGPGVVFWYLNSKTFFNHSREWIDESCGETCEDVKEIEQGTYMLPLDISAGKSVEAAGLTAKVLKISFSIKVDSLMRSRLVKSSTNLHMKISTDEN